jgi:hypothetical protein
LGAIAAPKQSPPKPVTPVVEPDEDEEDDYKPLFGRKEK